MTMRASQPDAHDVRPTDLPALVTFDEEVFENHAYTRERLARPEETPGPLAAAIEDWLGLGRRTWVDMRGRQIEGIATARALSRQVWLFDTLIDASAGDSTLAVLGALLRKAREAASEDRVTHVLLRTRCDSPALQAALHEGFKQVLVESTWRGRLAPARPAAERIEVRLAEERDEMARFQLFNQVLPLDAREAFALSFDEWRDTRERRWLQRGGTAWVAQVRDRVVGALELSSSRSNPQLEVVAASGEEQAVDALLEQAAAVLTERRGSRLVQAIAIAGSSAERTLRDRGLEPRADYAQLCLRLARPIRAAQRASVGLVVPTRG
ncbi:MAG: hypothetical protein IT299_01935 [Dehalococcoidia bacterium]|nr:hypothetical protein [Dehalococcoidia bacterium]